MKFFLDLAPLKKHRNYRYLFVGQMTSFVGSMVTHVATPYQLFELTKSSTLVGLLGAVQLVPLIIFGLWGGAAADAFDRRKLLIYSELGLALCSLGLLLNAQSSSPSVVAIFLLSATMSALNGLHRPSLDALSPRLVDKEDLVAISALGSLRSGVGMIVGPALGGWLTAAFGVAAAYGFDFISFSISLICLAAMSGASFKSGDGKSDLSSIKDGFLYAKSRPELIGTYVVDIVAMLFAFPTALFPALSQKWGGAAAAGALYSAISVGAIVSTIFSGWCKRVYRRGAAVVISAFCWGLAIVALGFAESFELAIACLIIAGVADGYSGLFRGAIWNETIPHTIRGRLASIEMISYMSGPLLGQVRAGWVAAATTTSISIWTGGLSCCAGVAACVKALPEFWRYDSRES